jgi:hypothetical protein
MCVIYLIKYNKIYYLINIYIYNYLFNLERDTINTNFPKTVIIINLIQIICTP